MATPNKPSWLPLKGWITLLDRYDGIPRCEETGVTEDLSIDHSVPRHKGGSDDPSNLRFLVKRLNFQKSDGPDQNWTQHFYFDDLPDFDKCRAGQLGIYNAIMAQADWFGEPSSQIGRLLYIAAMVVAAGKTLSILTAACAYNQVVRARWGAARRANRILVICKERAIRDQLAADLTKDPKRFGIMTENPRVAVIKYGSQLHNDAWLMSHDIVVTCIQQLWDSSPGRLAPLLHKFPLIFIDEIHYAVDKVQYIIDQAATSVCFGFTGTPIDGAGELLQSMVNVYTFGYDQANQLDRSMKHLSAANWQDHVHIADLDSATILDLGQVATRNDTAASGYAANFEPAKTVAWRVILHMEHCDHITTTEKAPHRREQDCEVGVLYPMHAMISCDSVRFANKLAETINAMFNHDRKRWPRHKGWDASVVHCEADEADGTKRADKPLSPNHAWLRAKNNPGYRIDAECSRILIVVGIGREGVNNPLCGVIGLTSDKASQLEVSQRFLGRQMRSVVRIVKENGQPDRLLVPPMELDTVTIFIHEVFTPVLDAIHDGIDFVCNMEARLEALPTILDLQNGRDPAHTPKARDDFPLPFETKIKIAGAIGGDADVDIDSIVDVFGGGNPRTERKVVDWIDTVRTDPVKAYSALGFGRILNPIATVLMEELHHELSDERLKAFLLVKIPALKDRPIDDSNRDFIKELYKRDAMEVNAATPPLLNADGTERHLSDVRRNLAGSILRSLGQHFHKTRESDEELHSSIASAVKQVLGVPKEESARDSGQWDIPHCHMILERTDRQNEIQRWVIARLIQRGYCPALSALWDGGHAEAAA
jgi:hypothetical protein